MNKAIALGSTPKQSDQDHLVQIANELLSGSLVVRKQSDPTDQRTKLYSNAYWELRYRKNVFVLLKARNMNRGLTWTKDEVKCLIDIWSDEHISEQLSKTHINTEVYKVFSKHVNEMGFNRCGTYK